ncbi:MAG TPA: DUF6438 domain-containing protein [Hymenobacter sp.]
MRHFTLLLLLLGFSCSLPACAQNATSSTRQAKPKKPSKKEAAREAQAKAVKEQQEKGPVLTFERTPCFGICPAYSMQVFADGRVAYEGRRAVPMLGKQELRLPAAAVADMLRTAKEFKFETFDRQYSRGTTDLPSTVIAVRQPNGQLKTVTVEEGAPQNVQAFVAYLTSQFDKLAQVGVNPDR